MRAAAISITGKNYTASDNCHILARVYNYMYRNSYGQETKERVLTYLLTIGPGDCVRVWNFSTPVASSLSVLSIISHIHDIPAGD